MEAQIGRSPTNDRTMSRVDLPSGSRLPERPFGPAAHDDFLGGAGLGPEGEGELMPGQEWSVELGTRRRTLQVGLAMSMLPRFEREKPINRRAQAQNSYVSAVI